MNAYLIILLSLSLATALAKATGWRPREFPNWAYAIEVVLVSVALAWVVYSIA